MNILVRADSSSSIGAGHIMRDLVLVEQFKDANIIFATQDLPGNINHKIVESGYKIEILKSNDILELDDLIKKHNIELIVIDHYNIDWKYEKQLKIWNLELKIFSFDDTYEKHYCDILLNQSIHTADLKYKNLVSNNTKLLCGSDYILLDDNFYNIKNKNIKQEKYVLITLGGGDTLDTIINILEALPENMNIKIISSQFKNSNSIKNNNVEIIEFTNEIATLMKKSSLIICSLGMTFFEVLFLEKKYIAIQTADNQNEIKNYFKDKNVPIFKAEDINKINLKLVFSNIENNFYDTIKINPVRNFIQKIL